MARSSLVCSIWQRYNFIPNIRCYQPGKSADPHIVKAENEAKYWLEPDIELAENFGFSNKELGFIEKILKEYANEFKIKFARHTGKRLDDK